ncbi:MAG TPA: sugar ABC transporter permease [Spirochaetales bacterium]|nr:sugar ABC transporter permease [Spirochaetales bacterium]HRY55808.1 sugar ABC transporter permease [Spirochaetia bacterium]HRZ65311.1 sugar ABC transporter permease [Spirochaetia bacterium]
MKRDASGAVSLETEGLLAFVLLAPALAVIAGVLVYPMLSSLGLSFTDLKLTDPRSGRFIGLGNYGSAFRDPLFWESLRRTVIFALSTVLAETSLGVALALLLNQRFFGRGFVRGLVILPWALPYVVNGIMWKWIFDANYGAFNAALTQLGIIGGYRIWLGDPAAAMALVIFANVWKETPVAILLALAALQSIPRDIYEAAEIDGSGKLRSFARITLPLLRPIVMSLVVIKTIWALKEFDLIYVMTKGGPANGTNMFSYYIYQHSFQFLNFGYGSALAYLLTLLAIAMSVAYMKGLKGGSDVEA